MGHAVTGCPGDLDSTGKARWRLVRDDFGDAWSDVYAATLERYVRFLGAADEALEELHWVRPDRIAEGAGLKPYRTTKLQLTTTGSQGQTVQHPTWKTYLEALRGAASEAEALSLTPRARAKAGEQKAAVPAGKFAGRL